jgi:hypothetical protein
MVYKVKVITKLPNSEQSYKGKVKTHLIGYWVVAKVVGCLVMGICVIDLCKLMLF